MDRKGKAEYFFRVFVIGIGFFNGLWIALGVNPESELINALCKVIKILSPESFEFIYTLVAMFSLLSLIASIFVAYQLGGKLGLLAIGLGFLSGFIIISMHLIGTLLLLISFLLSIFATSKDDELSKQTHSRN